MDQLEQLKEYMAAGAYDKVVALLPSIKERSVKSSSDLMLLARAYSKCADIAHVEKFFKKAYKVRPSKLLYRDMVEMCLDCGSVEAAEGYLQQYEKVAPGDTLNLCALKYRIEKKKDSDYSVRIKILKEIKEYEYIPQWAYELAKVYHKANMKDECISELEEIVASFDPEESVAIKAKTLLSYYHGEISADEIKARGKIRDEKEHQQMVEAALEKPKAEAVSEEETSRETIRETEEDEETPETVKVEEKSEGNLEAAEETEAPQELPKEDVQVSKDTIIAEAEDEIIQQLEEEKEAEEKFAEAEKEKNNIPLYAPKFALSQDDLKDSKAKRVIVKNQIHIEDVCKNFFRVADVRRQIFNSLDLAVNERDKIYICVTGEPGIGKTTLAARLVRLFFLAGVLKTDRLARADAEKLGSNGPKALKNMLKKYNVLIENAGELSTECVDALVEQAGDRKSGTCVVLEDNSRNINTLFRNSTTLRELANNRIHLTKYDNNDLLGFAYDICRENEYLLAQSAADALVGTLENNRMNESKRFAYVMDIMKKAVKEADRRYAPGILKMAAEAAFSEDYSLVLTEEDIKP